MKMKVHGYALGPFIIPAGAISQTLGSPSLVVLPGLVVTADTQQLHKFFIIYQDIFSSGLLDLIVSGPRPFRWVVNNTGVHHVRGWFALWKWGRDADKKNETGSAFTGQAYGFWQLVELGSDHD